MPYESIKVLIGRRIAEVRKMQKYTQKELAEELDVEKGTVSRWENGERPPTTERLDEIARALRVDPLVLVNLDSKDYQIAMKEAAAIVEGRMRSLVEDLRSLSSTEAPSPNIVSPNPDDPSDRESA